MPLDDHKAIDEVSDDTPICRYYRTSRFLSLVETESLYFSRIDRFEDPFEGYAPVKNLRKEVEYRERLEENFEELYKAVSGDPPNTDFVNTYEFVRGQTLANCWSEGKEDKLTMWNSYIPDGDGVSISTTFGKLKSAIRNGSDFQYHAGEVKYFDYFSRLLESNNFFDFVMSKPAQYRFENEVRLLMWWPEHGDVNLGKYEPGDVVDLPSAPEGDSFKVELETLIDNVYISPFSPPWLTVDSLSSILSEMGLDVDVNVSNLAMEPQEIL